MKYHFKIHKEGSGYWAECLELKGCRTQAKSRAALDKNMREALNLFLDEPDDSSLAMPYPKAKVAGSNVVVVPVETSVAFAFCLRQMRQQRRMTQQQVAEALHMKNLWSYQRLERSKHSNPSLDLLARIKRVFPRMPLDNIME